MGEGREWVVFNLGRRSRVRRSVGILMPRPRFHHPYRAGDSLLEALTLSLRTRRSARSVRAKTQVVCDRQHMSV
jgi:hypothetical protein